MIDVTEVDLLHVERELARCSLIDFIAQTAPWFVIEEIHCHIADELEQMVAGEFDRLMIFMPPRAGKSQTISRFFPAWYIGQHPRDQILQTTHTAELAIDHGRAVRDMIADPAYQQLFPGIKLRGDMKAAGHWAVEHDASGQRQGEYYAAGVGGAIAGRGWNLGIVDDPLSEQDKDSDIARKRARDWWGPGFYTRRQPERNMIVLMSTRWATDDLPGHLLDQAANHGADQWRICEIPALLTERAAKKLNLFTGRAVKYDQIRRREGDQTFRVPARQLSYSEGQSYAPRRWRKAELERSRDNMPERDWQALYLQNPSQEEGNILKRSCWRKWPHNTPPECYEVIAYYDTAMEEDEQADFTARTTWGLFDFQGLTHVILLEAWQGRVPASRDRSDPDGPGLIEIMEDHHREYEPDRIKVEKRATGSWIVREARKRRLPARTWLPPRALGPRSKGKTARAYFASIALEGGAVWYFDRRWAEMVISQCAAVPFGDFDDIADTCTMALIDLRERWRLELRGVDDQEEDEEDDWAA